MGGAPTGKRTKSRDIAGKQPSCYTEGPGGNMGYRVLVVDDSPVLRIMLREMIESLGHEVVEEAEDAADLI